MATNSISKFNSLAFVDKNMFSGRPESVVKEGVWINVQPHMEESLAVRDAVVEQKRMEEIILKKQQRFRQFHRNVRRRVAERLKAQQRLVCYTETENVKIEQHIIYQSIAELQNATSKRKCIMYNLNPLMIDGSRILRSQSGQEKNIAKEQTMLSKQSTKIKEIHSRALETLLKRQLKTQTPGMKNGLDDVDSNSLPGGLWGTSTTRDKSAVRSTHHSKLCSAAQIIESNTPQTITAPNDIVQEGSASSVEAKLHKQDMHMQMKNSSTQAYVVKSNEIMKEYENDQKDCLIHDFQRNAHASCSVPNSIHYRSGKNKEWKEQQVVPHEQLGLSNVEKFMVTRMGNDSQFFRPSLVEHERRKMNQRVQLLCRRVFSDMEREKVRQERKRREHKCKVEQLRAEKEIERMQKEHDHDKNVAMATTKPDQEKLGKEIEKREKLLKKQEKMHHHKRNLRYACALKAQIKQRMNAISIDLPPLCCCSPSFWDTDPFTCANNCVFYKNIEAYTVALHSVLSSIERSTRNLQEKSHSIISLPMDDD